MSEDTIISKAPIVVAIEPYEEGRHVFAVASRIAKSQRRALHPINVVRPAIAFYADLDFSPLNESVLNWQSELLRENRDFLAQLPGLAPDHLDRLTVIAGNPIHEISDSIEKTGANLAIMGVHNRKGLKRLLGSTTHGVLNSTHCDVLAVHPDGDAQAYRRILIAVDTSDLLDQVLATATRFAEAAERIDIVSVIVPLNLVFPSPEAGMGLQPSFTALTNDIKTQARAKITAAADSAGLSNQAVNIRVGEPRDEIIAAANEVQADLIVLGSNNHSAMSRLLLGSTARGVLNRTPCDVMVCRQR